ncbi:PHD domain-containing protein, partial [Cephalotus follicularis]
WSKAGPEIIGGAKCCPNAIISYRFKNPHDPLVVDIRKHLSYLGWKIEYTKSKGMGALLFRYTSPAGKRYNSLVQLCQDMRKSTTMDMHTDMEIMRKSTMDMDMEIMTKSTTTDMEMEVHPPSKPDRLPHIKLKWLMDNNAVFPEDKVHYRDRKGGPPLAAGRITRHGIKCNCCHKVFTLTSFEAHAGSKNHRPAANIILENGKSLLDCQIQLAGDSKARSKKTKKHHGMKNELVEEDNDFICTVCHCDGELILCDQCPSSFHKSCLGLKDVPDGKWFCHSCCCAICLQRAVKESTEDSTNNSVHTCYQCERKYHAGCLRSRDVPMSESSVEGKWFCGSNCEKIYSGLHELLGRPIQVGVNDLTWTLVKCTDQRQYYSKLNAALEVMHECFMPCKEAGRDLVEDVIFSRPSELNRLNFKGFYTILLERRKKLISAATVRIYGKEVAEMPLIGTRVKYRGGGMCRTLMNELEKKLKELEVERLVLPAAHSVLKAWTTRFGFSQMTDSERVQFLKYTFLNFHGTIMCQKVLEKS